jgi:hypothetical protein
MGEGVAGVQELQELQNGTAYLLCYRSYLSWRCVLGRCKDAIGENL